MKIFSYEGKHGCINFASNFTGLSVSCIFKKVQKGTIPYHRIPDSNKIIFYAYELDQWIRKSDQ